MLEAKHDNSQATFSSFSIKLLKVAKSIRFLNLDSWIWQNLVHHLTTNDP
jgi:hypothetical protein